MKKCYGILLTTILIILYSISSYATVEFPAKTDVPLNKYWRIKFNMSIDESTINQNNVYILDSKGNKYDCELSLLDVSKSDSIEITPKTNYNYGESYTLYIKDVKSAASKELKDDITMGFSTIKKVEEIINFPDRNLESIIRKKVNKPTGDIYKSDVENITVLDCSESGIFKLEGIQNLVSLQNLMINNNKISDISLLKDLTNLKSLWASYNQIGDVSALENLTNLESLMIYNNRIRDISSLKNLIRLRKLCLYNNKISDISALKNLMNLTTLYISGNPIEDYSPTTGYYRNLVNKDFELNINDNTGNVIYFPDANLEVAVREKINKPTGNIYISDVDQIIELDCSSRGISNIEGMQYLTGLDILNLYNNKVTDISPIKYLTNIRSLFLGYNQIKDISVLENLTNLKALSLYNNEISDITPLRNLRGLTQLFIHNNKISDLSILENLTNLTRLRLTGNLTTDYSPVKGYYKNLIDKDFELNETAENDLANCLEVQYFNETSAKEHGLTEGHWLVCTKAFEVPAYSAVYYYIGPETSKYDIPKDDIGFAPFRNLTRRTSDYFKDSEIVSALDDGCSGKYIYYRIVKFDESVTSEIMAGENFFEKAIDIPEWSPDGMIE